MHGVFFLSAYLKSPQQLHILSHLYFYISYNQSSSLETTIKSVEARERDVGRCVCGGWELNEIVLLCYLYFVWH